ncbi:MAG TPA: cytochrome c3 family protein [Burkholderiales bacterium]|nr:cytochrome c3 family protein [Burkholderiales bacterium]
MEIQVTYVSTSAAGLPQREQRRLAGTTFRIGRGTQCEIHLPDARVALVHARLLIDEEGARLEAEPHRIVHNDREVGGAKLAVGDVIEIGPYVLIVEPPPEGVALAFSVRLSKRVSTKQSTAIYRVLMRTPPLSKRRLSYLAFFGLLALLLAPMAVDLLGREVPAVRALSIGLAQTWNPGPLARGHQGFSQDCRTCHELPFIQVRDHACMACHTGVREHVAPERRTGFTKVAFIESRCAECHRDHKGRAMAPRSQQLCVNCHGADGVSDFATAHPEFRLALVDGDRPDEIRRVRMRDASGPVVEHSNLKFNHTLHLDSRGVRHPRGRRVLGCEACHERAEGGARMVPVSMEKHCSECHALSFEPKVTGRQVPHGPVKQMQTMLREFYARLALGDVPADVAPPGDLPRVRPGAMLTPEERQQVMRVADAKAQRVMREMVETRAVCSTCHHVSRSRAGEWQVAPVALTAAWMPGATFTHARHVAQPCITCHDVRGSRRAEDVAMPAIAQCRECHGGATPAMGKIASDCAACHRFHGGQGLWH